ncbi:MAG: lipid A-modifier LpxR family protein [Gemmatimonadota bacterium]
MRLRRFPVLLALCATTASAQDPPPQGLPLWQQHRTFSFYAENDAFGGISDSGYTNGFRLGWDFATWSPRLHRLARLSTGAWLLDALPFVRIADAPTACTPLGGHTRRPCGTVGFAITETMYTPSDLSDTTLQANDRPYAGLLFASGTLNYVERYWQASSEFVVGVLGPWSQSESTQNLAHWTWSPNSVKPRGWRNQLRNSLQYGLINSYSGRHPKMEWCRDSQCNGLYSEGRTLDLTPRAELVATTYMQRASIGGVLRAGNRFPDVLSVSRISTTAARGGGSGSDSQVWWNGFVAYDARAVHHSAFISGTSEDRGNGGWRDRSLIDETGRVTEFAFGGSIGAKGTSVTFQIIKRSSEYEPGGGSHRFGALSVSLFTQRGPS